MHYFYIFITGFFAAVAGTAPPGLLNMTAGKIAYEYSREKGDRFIIGSGIISMLYCFIATQFSFYIDTHPDFVMGLYKAAAVIFGILTVYFFLKGRYENRQIAAPQVERNNFLITGIFLSMLNILPIPFYTATALLLASNRLFHFTMTEMLVMILSVVAGTVFVLKLYAIYYPRIIERRSKVEGKKEINTNFIVAAVTLLVKLTAILKILFTTR